MNPFTCYKIETHTSRFFNISRIESTTPKSSFKLLTTKYKSEIIIRICEILLELSKLSDVGVNFTDFTIESLKYLLKIKKIS